MSGLLLAVSALASVGSLDACFADATDSREPYRCAYRVARSSGDYAPVIARVRAEHQAHPDHAWALHTLGSLLTDQGEKPEGVAAFEGARDAFDRDGDVLGRVYSRLNLGKEAHQRGDYDGARDSYLAAADIAEAAGRTDLQHAARLSLARGMLHSTARLGEAWSLATAVHDQIFPDGEYQTQLLALHVLQRVAGATDRPEELVALLERQAALVEGAGDRYVLAMTRLDLAQGLNSLAARGKLQRVHLRVRSLLDEVDTEANPYAAALAPCMVAEAARLDGLDAEARREADRCVTATATFVDVPEDRIVARMVRATVTARSAPQVSRADFDAARALAPDRNAAAALDVERLHLLQLAGDRQALRDHLPAALSALTLLRGAQDDPSSRAGFVASRGHFVATAATWLAGVGADDPSRAAARSEAPVVTSVPDDDVALALALSDVVRGRQASAAPFALPALQASLHPDEVLVSYLFPPHLPGGWAAVITPDAARVVALPAGDLIEPIRAWRSLLQERDPLAAAGARTLFDRLIAPLDLPDGARRLTVVAHGPVHDVPFDALVGPDGAPLAARYAIGLAPSLAERLERPSPPGPPPRRVLALADPSDPGGDRPPLPHARDEAAAVLLAMGDGDALFGDAATRDALLTSGDADWLHLAAHVQLDDRFPERAALLLAGGERVTAADVRRGRWSSPVVVLSACHSASGRSQGGQLPQGLTRAFLDVGARAVVGSLWPVEDRETRDFFTALYARLGRGEPLGAALAATKREQAASGVAPAAWAAFVLYGDGDVVGAAPPRLRAAWPWAGVGLLVLALLGWKLHTRRQSDSVATRSG